jgi:hypothetical protein
MSNTKEDFSPDLSTPSFAIFDDFLDEDSWSWIWTAFQTIPLEPVTPTAGAWKIHDSSATALCGEALHSAARSGKSLTPDEQTFPTEGPFDPLIEKVEALALSGEIESWLSSPDWKHVAMRPYIYPKGSALGWHRDNHSLYAGAFVYYPHPSWHMDFGGELMVAETLEPETFPVMPHRFDSYDFDEALSEGGFGHYISPKPNRLVIVGNQPHRVAPVRDSAGIHSRASVAGFFMR